MSRYKNPNLSSPLSRSKHPKYGKCDKGVLKNLLENPVWTSFCCIPYNIIVSKGRVPNLLEKLSIEEGCKWAKLSFLPPLLHCLRGKCAQSYHKGKMSRKRCLHPTQPLEYNKSMTPFVNLQIQIQNT